MDDFRYEGVDEALEEFRQEIEEKAGGKIEWAVSDSEVGTVRVRIKRNNLTIELSKWTMYELPGNCGVAISSDIWINPEYRRRGLNHVFNKVRQRMAQLADYGALIATTIADTESVRPENATLRRREFTAEEEFCNPNTGNKVILWFKNLNGANL